MFRSSAQKLAFSRVLNRIVFNLGEEYRDKLEHLSKLSAYGISEDSLDPIVAGRLVSDLFDVAFPKDNQGNWKHSFQGRVELIQRVQKTINELYANTSKSNLE